uniref:Ptk1 n=1 Tax=Arundo donax TaxID=35708 RepID=A0A0A9HZX5_ARUDO
MNLVRIWGFCSEISHRMLVTEYIENGSLANILFKDNIKLEAKVKHCFRRCKGSGVSSP